MELKTLGNILQQTLTVALLMLYYQIKGIVFFFVPRKLRFKSVVDEVVLVTGGGNGLGRALAVRLAKLGAKIVVWDINKPGIDETCRLVKASGGRATGYEVDITDRLKVYSTAERVRTEVGPVTMLFNNAGIVTGKRFLEIDDEKIIQTFNVNSLAHFWTIKAFLPDMMAKNHGHLVSIASVAGYVGAPKLTDYCASKSAAVGLEESLRLELKHDGYDGIHSTAVCPYFINTGLFEGFTSNILPSLETDDVAETILTGVLTNQPVIAIPRLFYFLHVLKVILPLDALYTLYEALGGFETMKHFIGRQPPAATANGRDKKLDHNLNER